jgi:hypothetical protein
VASLPRILKEKRRKRKLVWRKPRTSTRNRAAKSGPKRTKGGKLQQKKKTGGWVLWGERDDLKDKNGDEAAIQ